jgi:putative ABC transport system permease protein
MFDRDRWEEIFNSIRRHKLRTALTALGVIWGILMLVLLLGAGYGLQNGIDYQFSDDATNSIWIRSGTTSKEYKGLPKGRYIEFTNDDFDYLDENFPEIEHLSGRFWLSGDRTVSYKQKTVSYQIRSVHPGYRFVEKIHLEEGRFLNQTDIDGFRKVAVIGQKVKTDLFGEEDAIGKEIAIGGIVFSVGGWFSDPNERETRVLYLPISTAQKVYIGTEEIHQLMFTAGDLSVPKMNDLADQIHFAMAQLHRFDPTDRRAVNIFNLAEQYEEFQNLMFAIRAFVWFVGIGTLLAGVIGVSNIMLIIVKDRTREIGIRKALGATPRSIVTMILQEAIFLTGLAGYIGLVLGVGILYLASPFESEYFRNPEVNIGVVIAAVIVLTVAGALAGLMPALQAARINPITAMKSD